MEAILGQLLVLLHRLLLAGLQARNGVAATPGLGAQVEAVLRRDRVSTLPALSPLGGLLRPPVAAALERPHKHPGRDPGSAPKV